MSVDMLAKHHPHERDARISFEEGPHIYTIDGDSNYMSVTTWNHKHFEQFDADAIITKMMSGANWTRSKYHGMTREEIKAQWEANRDAAATAGTALHYDIECYYNGMDVENDSVEYNYFREFVADNRGLVPYRTEWMVWDARVAVCGQHRHGVRERGRWNALDLRLEAVEGNPEDVALVQVRAYRVCEPFARHQLLALFPPTQHIQGAD